jgi:hypothetical protein
MEISSVLESCLNLAIRLKRYQFSLIEYEPDSNASNSDTIVSIETYAADIQTYQRSIASIIQSLQGTFDLVGHTLSYLFSARF